MTSKEREGVLGEGGYLFERDNVWEKGVFLNQFLLKTELNRL